VLRDVADRAPPPVEDERGVQAPSGQAPLDDGPQGPLER
jgi:hypothetical protein